MVLNMLEPLDGGGIKSTAQNLSVVVNVWGKDDPSAFRRSIMSIRAQETKAKELIIVIDGPINTLLDELIQELDDLKPRVIRIPQALGLWNARNIGIDAASTEYIALHDADDVMHPKRLTHQLQEIEERKADVVASPVYEFDSKTEQVIGVRKLSGNSNLVEKMLWQNVINHSSVLLRKSAVISIGGYKNVYLAEDYDLWLRLIIAGKKLTTSKYVLQAFSVDQDLAKRRGGSEFISSEIAIHRLVRSTNKMGLLASWVRLVARIAFRVGPSFVRKAHRRTMQLERVAGDNLNLNEFLKNAPPIP